MYTLYFESFSRIQTLSFKINNPAIGYASPLIIFVGVVPYVLLGYDNCLGVVFVWVWSLFGCGPCLGVALTG